MATLYSSVILAVISAALVQGQRPSFAGTIRPIGFPEIQNKTTASPLDNRFGESTTEKLPPQAHGDRDYIDRISKFPIDQQPFWYLNWQASQANKNNRPQTYPQRPSHFAEPHFGTSGSLLNINAGSSAAPDLGNRYGEEENNVNSTKNPMVEAGLQSPRNNMTAFGHFPSQQ